MASDVTSSDFLGAQSARLVSQPEEGLPELAPTPPSARYVDPTGKDATKNDEEPSPRDGRTSVDAGYSDGVCPLLSDEEPKERRTVDVGGHEMTVTQPFRVLVDPVACPTCKKKVESHQLTWDVKGGSSERDCAVAISLRDHPVSREVQTALDEGETARAQRITNRHPWRERFLRFLGLREKQEDEKHGMQEAANE